MQKAKVDHIALQVQDIQTSVAWYQEHFHADLLYQDASWAFLQLANIKLALVLPHQHPPHVAFTSKHAAKYGDLVRHRDGTRSVYISDPSGNQLEVMQAD